MTEISFFVRTRAADVQEEEIDPTQSEELGERQVWLLRDQQAERHQEQPEQWHPERGAPHGPPQIGCDRALGHPERVEQDDDDVDAAHGYAERAALDVDDLGSERLVLQHDETHDNREHQYK